MAMSKKALALGQVELRFLLVILGLKQHATCAVITSTLLEQTGQRVVPGALYSTLDRLTDKKYVAFEWLLPAQRRGGRACRYYKVTLLGKSIAHECVRGIVALSRKTFLA